MPNNKKTKIKSKGTLGPSGRAKGEPPPQIKKMSSKWQPTQGGKTPQMDDLNLGEKIKAQPRQQSMKQTLTLPRHQQITTSGVEATVYRALSVQCHKPSAMAKLNSNSHGMPYCKRRTRPCKDSASKSSSQIREWFTTDAHKTLISI